MRPFLNALPVFQYKISFCIFRSRRLLFAGKAEDKEDSQKFSQRLTL